LAVRLFNVLLAPKLRRRPVSTVERELVTPTEIDRGREAQHLSVGHGVQGARSSRLECIHPQGLLSPT